MKGFLSESLSFLREEKTKEKAPLVIRPLICRPGTTFTEHSLLYSSSYFAESDQEDNHVKIYSPGIEPGTFGVQTINKESDKEREKENCDVTS